MNANTLILAVIAGVTDYALDGSVKKALILAAVVGVAYYLVCSPAAAPVASTDYPSIA